MSEDSTPTILLVDDDELVLTAIKALFMIESGCRILTYTSPVEALEDLDRKSYKIDLVVSDYHMPEMDGISFLGQVRDRFPHAPRILLTGYPDRENAIRAINHVGLYQYIEKPWDNDDLRLIIRNGLEKTSLIKQLEEKTMEAERAQSELRSVQKDILRVFA